jgi:hypothetical protein
VVADGVACCPPTTLSCCRCCHPTARRAKPWEIAAINIATPGADGEALYGLRDIIKTGRVPFLRVQSTASDVCDRGTMSRWMSQAGYGFHTLRSDWTADDLLAALSRKRTNSFTGWFALSDDASRAADVAALVR